MLSRALHFRRMILMLCQHQEGKFRYSIWWHLRWIWWHLHKPFFPVVWIQWCLLAYLVFLLQTMTTFMPPTTGSYISCLPSSGQQHHCHRHGWLFNSNLQCSGWWGFLLLQLMPKFCELNMFFLDKHESCVWNMQINKLVETEIIVILDSIFFAGKKQAQRPSEENNRPCLLSRSKCACVIRSWCSGMQ